MLTEAKFKVVYSTGEDEPADFFLNALLNSNQFDLCLGYFHSSGFRALALGFAYFIYKGGGMRMIINDTLSQEDKEAIEKGFVSSPEELIEKRFIETLNAIYETLCSYEKHFFNCISWLISKKKLDIIIISPKSGGIAHQKFGIFRDSESNIIVFNGSANFSKSALKHNLEAINCFYSWSGEPSSSEAINYFDKLFNKYWNSQSADIKIIPIKEAKTFIRKKFPVDNIDDLLQEERELNRKIINGKPKATNVNIELKNKIDDIVINNIPKIKPSLPKNISLYDYQKKAYENWVDNEYQGFFEMATGTGKTITALNCVLQIYKKEGKVISIILVPTLDLANQWNSELELFGFNNIIQVNSKNPDWYKELLYSINQLNNVNTNIIIISTYSSFVTDKFQSFISKTPDNSIVIADEAHNFGTKRMVDIYPHNIKRRIGLSATPARYFDEEGTNSLLEYFNSTEKPTLRFTMEEAIDKGFLSKYYYYPRIIRLTHDEMVKYKEISLKLMKYLNPKTGRYSDDPIVATLLMKRKRIIHKAANKLDCFRQIISDILKIKGELKYTLVYVPEGRPDDYDDEDQRLINEYSAVISKEFNLKQHQFTGSTKNRDNILDLFSKGNISVLTAMKCLDEGVDVKRTEVAIFCASTGNPRQFIQRRGRILRTHPDKKFAYIYDIIVVPIIVDSYLKESIEMERKLFQTELLRVKEFANIALNKYDALSSLEKTCNEFYIDIYSTNKG